MQRAVIYELITALQLTAKLLYVFTYRSVKPHLTELLSTTPLNCAAQLPSAPTVPETAYDMDSAACRHVALPSVTHNKHSCVARYLFSGGAS